MAAKRHALAERRRAVGKSQEQLAALVGVERSTGHARCTVGHAR